MRRAFFLALFCAALLSVSSLGAQDQSSTLPSMDTAPASSAITPSERLELLTLRRLLVQASQKSRTSDQSWLTQQQMQSEADKQRQSDNEQRNKEQQQLQQDLQAATAKAQAAQTYLNKLLPMLTDFSGSEDEKEAAAIKAVDTIKADAKALESEGALLRIGCVTLGVSTGALAVYTVGHLALHWW